MGTQDLRTREIIIKNNGSGRLPAFDCDLRSKLLDWLSDQYDMVCYLVGSILRYNYYSIQIRSTKEKPTLKKYHLRSH